MGWFHGYNSRKQVVDELCQPYTDEETGYQRRTIKRCLRGNVLWSIVEVRNNRNSTDWTRFIACDLMRRYDGDWGYKPMEESCGPNYCTCPLMYLDMVPVADEEWREQVRQYHDRKRRQR